MLQAIALPHLIKALEVRHAAQRYLFIEAKLRQSLPFIFTQLIQLCSDF